MFMLAVWQGLERDSISAGNTRLLMIFVGVVALSMLSQAIVVIVLAIGARKAQDRLLVIIEELRSKVTPLLKSAEDLSQVTIPKIKSITENLLQTSHIVRAKAQDFDATLTDVNVRAKAQVARADGMISTALTATGTLAAMVHHGIKTPLVEAVGLINGFRAGIDVLMKRSGGVRTKNKAITLYKGDGAGL